MKIHALFTVVLIGVLSATSAKGHRGRVHHSHAVDTTKPDEPRGGVDRRKILHHEITNKMSPSIERRREHILNTKAGSLALSKLAIGTSSKAHSLKRVKKISQSQTDEKSLLRGSPVEHNVNKKQLEYGGDGIPLEKEFLFHVTPSPPSKRKMKKGQVPKRRLTTSNPKMDKSSLKDGQKLSKMNSKTSVSSIRKVGKFGKGSKMSSRGTSTKRYPKKYNPQKHGWKKSPKKEKLSEKIKEKRDKMKKREKRIRKAKNNHKMVEKITKLD